MTAAKTARERAAAVLEATGAFGNYEGDLKVIERAIAEAEAAVWEEAAGEVDGRIGGQRAAVVARSFRARAKAARAAVKP